MLKLSGEALQGKQGFGIDYEVLVCWCTAQTYLPHRRLQTLDKRLALLYAGVASSC